MYRLCKASFYAVSIIVSVVMIFMSVGYFYLPDSYTSVNDVSLQFKGVMFSGSAKTGDGSSSNNTADGSVDIDFLRVFPVKTVPLTLRPRKYVMVGGDIFGLKMYTDGVVIVDIDSTDEANEKSPAELAGLMIGDSIISIDGKRVVTTVDVSQCIKNSRGQPLKLEFKRNSKSYSTVLTPRIADDNSGYKAGLWLRDSMAGMGTITFYDPNAGIYAGLGHAVCDVDSGRALPLAGGEILDAKISSCVKSENGKTGELSGYFGNRTIGNILLNCSMGVYGEYSVKRSSELLAVAAKEEIKVGPAKVIASTDNDGKREYDIEIKSINTGATGREHNMIIRITDPSLLAKTGGIVQGMSGSPIVQNGMLVGAVTHVFLNNCTEGYAIFAENMINTAQYVKENLIDNAA